MSSIVPSCSSARKRVIRYYDTSALYALWVPQPFTERAKEELKRDFGQVVISRFAVLEFKSALLKDVRLAALERGKAAVVWSRFYETVQAARYRVLPVSSAYLERAADLLDIQLEPPPSLRAPDALHVGTAVAFGRIGFVTANAQQARAAREAGLRTAYLGVG